VEDNPQDAEMTFTTNKYLQMKYANIAKLPICAVDEVAEKILNTLKMQSSNGHR